MDVLALMYDMKEGLVGLKTIYSDADIKKYQVKSGKSPWIICSTQYMKNTFKTVEGLLNDEDTQLRKVKLARNQLLMKICQSLTILMS